MRRKPPKEEKQQPINIENLDSLLQDDSIVPYWDGKRYRNNRKESLVWNFLKTIYSLFPGMFSPSTTLPDLSILCIENPPLPQNTLIVGPTLSWLGHSTVYLRVNGLNILFDPSSSDVRPSPNSWIQLYKRHTSAPFDFDDLPVDIIFLSHNHEDHACATDLEKFSRRNYQPIIIAGENSSEWLQSLGFKPENITTISWWDRRRIINRTTKQKIDLLGVPAFHSSQPKQWTNPNQTKGSSGLNAMLWLGFVLKMMDEKESDSTLYFSGDTAIGLDMEDQHGRPHSLFDQLHKQVPKIDIACIEVSPEEEPESHLGSSNALKVLNTLKPTTCMPMHHSCFRSDKRPVEAAIIGFMQATLKPNDQKLATTILPLKIGAQISMTLAHQQPLHPDISKQFIPWNLWGNQSSLQPVSAEASALAANNFS